jgi:hypothetical protein
MDVRLGRRRACLGGGVGCGVLMLVMVRRIFRMAGMGVAGLFAVRLG